MQTCLFPCEVVWTIAGYDPDLGFLSCRFRSGLHADVRVSRARYKQYGTVTDGELQADELVFGAEKTEAKHHCTPDTPVMVFWVLAQMRPSDLGSDETLRMMIVGVKCE